MKLVGFIEKVTIIDEYMVKFSGYIKLNTVLDLNGSGVYLTIKNEEKYVNIENLKMVERTDLKYLLEEENVKSVIGFSDVPIKLNCFSEDNKKYDFGISIIDNSKRIFIPLKIKLSKELNKLGINYIKENKIRIEWKIDCEKNLYILTSKLNTFTKVVDYIKRIKITISRIRRLVKDRDYKTIIVLILFILFRRYLMYKKIWLIGERKDTAQDNSYFLYKYIKDNNLNINSYYLIDKKCKDYLKIRDYKNIIQWGSLKHNLYLLCSQYSINSYSEKPNMYTNEYIKISKWYPNLIKRKKIFLQHGVIGISKINRTLHKNRADIDLFVVSSDFEKKQIVDEYGYKPNEVIVTGLCRWDNLFNFNTEKIILIMPTWRKWIKNKDELVNSDFYKRYMGLLNNKSLLDLLERNNYSVYFYMHYKMQELCENLDGNFGSGRIKIINKNDLDVQALLKKSEILITDYSSVAFDFAFMRKKVIFYQFDTEEFYSLHYDKGPIDLENDLFGEVINREESVVNYLRGLIEENNNENYVDIEKVYRFIKFIDNKNCERFLNKIMK